MSHWPPCIFLGKWSSPKPSPRPASCAAIIPASPSSPPWALHVGHLSLIDVARKHAPHVAVSIFVNPTQFGPRRLPKIPAPVEADLAKCADAGVDFVFNPTPEDMYPARAFAALATPGGPSQQESEIQIDIPNLSGVLEGRVRPNHFRGVCQVVAKLFNILRPDVACFGQKDYQQLRILTAMTESLDFPVQIVPCPTIREPDGLACSSRNQYLTPPSAPAACPSPAPCSPPRTNSKKARRRPTA